MARIRTRYMMMNHQGKKPLQIVDIQCSKFVGPLKQAFTDAGLWSFQSFDLQSTRALHDNCTCEYHGTSLCTCQLIVLLIYRALGDPITLVLDGRDEQTYIFIVEEKGPSVRPATREMIERIISKTAQKLFEQSKIDAGTNYLSEQI
ncbi:MAG: hypothetical protein ACYC3H_08685 [Bellilinea sp.]